MSYSLNIQLPTYLPMALILNKAVYTVVEKKTILGCAKVVLKERFSEHRISLEYLRKVAFII